MRTRRITTVVLVCIAAFALDLARGRAGADAGEKPAGAGYSIHEWGVFPVARGARWAKRSMLGEWSAMPAFFHGVLPGRKLQYFGPVFKPVVFFHGEQALTVQLRITFGEGRPLIWWPPATSPASFGGLPANARSNELHFGFHLNKSPLGGQRAKSYDVPAGHWVATLRQVKSAPVFVLDMPKRRGIGSVARESFIYYDGIIKALSSPTVTRDGSDIIVQSDSRDDWLDVLAIERIDGRVRVGAQWLDRVPAGKRQTRITLKDVTNDEQKVITGLAAQLKQRLVAAKLNEDEAGAMVEIWKKGLFERDGLTLFHRIPQKTYDRLLPMQAKPKPKQVVRVGLVMHERLEPEFAPAVKKLIEQLGSADFNTRDAAQRDLTKLGGPAFPFIEAAVNHKDPEIAQRCQKMLKDLDALQYVRPTRRSGK